jgi:hypothetical protein
MRKLTGNWLYKRTKRVIYYIGFLETGTSAHGIVMLFKMDLIEQNKLF